MKKLYLSLLLAVSCLTMTAEATTNVLEYTAPEWNEYPMTFTVTDNCWSVSGSEIEGSVRSEQQSTLTATVTVGENATLRYELNGGRDLSFIVDGEEIRSLTYNQLQTSRLYYQALSPGEHTIQWNVRNSSSSSTYYKIKNIGIETTPWITVTLLEPGSLGTEILYNVDHLKEVRNLKIIGSMNDDDWAKISMMKDNLIELDLSETDAREITKELFKSAACLKSIKLPEGLTKIGDDAFVNAYSLEYVGFPSTLESIGSWAFQYTSIISAILPDKCTQIGRNAFSNCRFLKNVKLSDALTEIDDYTFQDCYELRTFKLPEMLEAIGQKAFYNCSHVAFDFPESLKSIGYCAFQNTNRYGEKAELILPKNVSSIGQWAFTDSKYTYAEIPVSFYTLEYKEYFLPSTVTTIRLNCPTVIGRKSSGAKIVSDSDRPNITLQVPSFLVNAYKLDDYWYNFGKIEGFSTAEIGEWVINDALVLGARDRFEGNPSIEINTGGSLKINGTDGMSVADLSFKINPYGAIYGQMFSNADDVTVSGKLWNEFYTYKNQWYFMSLPYNIKVSDITSASSTAKRAIRYYDGAHRAENGAAGSWTDYGQDDIIPAGTGFIFQASEAGWWTLPSMEDESKQFLTSNNMFVKELAANPSDNASNRGWNLVGNPYQCWYNIHKLNFTAPITVRDLKNNTYAAYSVIDDDYAIAPCQAFFVQCPEGISNISFPLDGRQMTSVIESQVGAKPQPFMAQAVSRKIIDLSVSNNTFTDRTRVVINNAATTGYDASCDAGKFFSESEEVPQIYSLDAEGNKYAINERPETGGRVILGFIAPQGGNFTMQLIRNTMGNVILKDNETGSSVNISEQEYSFTSDAGTYENRFELYFTETTGIENTATVQQAMSVNVTENGISITGHANVEIFAASGAMVGKASVNGRHSFALPSGLYIVKSERKSVKVIVP
ncbi:MAG: leucine-rich repeat domain-containing protein [Prevotella sp.]|nr:leucine-rich repeat domain-containing protein [Prevotella sp.]